MPSFPIDLLNPIGVYKERLSQSALYAAMRTCADEEAQAVRTGSITKASSSRPARIRRPTLRTANSRSVQDVHRGTAHRR